MPISSQIFQIQQVLDREAIRHCILCYARGVDREEKAMVVDAYWPDATDEHGDWASGPLLEFVDSAMALRSSFSRTQHLIGNILIELVDDDKALAESYFHVYHCVPVEASKRSEEFFGGRYLDRLEKRDGNWRILHRRVVGDWARQFVSDAPADPNHVGGLPMR